MLLTMIIKAVIKICIQQVFVCLMWLPEHFKWHMGSHYISTGHPHLDSGGEKYLVSAYIMQVKRIGFNDG